MNHSLSKGSKKPKQLTFEYAQEVIQCHYVDRVLGFIHPDGQPKFLTPNEFLRVSDFVVEFCTTMPYEQLDRLYLYFINVFKRYLTDYAITSVESLDGTPLLRSYLKVWDNYAAFVGFLKRIYC